MPCIICIWSRAFVCSCHYSIIIIILIIDDLPGPGHAPDHPAGCARQPPRHRQRPQDQEPAQTESLLLRRQPRSSRWGRIHRDMSVE